MFADGTNTAAQEERLLATDDRKKSCCCFHSHRSGGGGSGGDDGSGDESRGQSLTNICCSSLYKVLTFYDLNLQQYRFLLLLSLAMNIVFLVSQVGRIVYIVSTHQIAEDDSFVLMLLVVVMTFSMALILVRLLLRPRPNLALLAVLLVLVTTILFIVEFVIYFQQIDDFPLFLGLWILFIFLEIYSAVVYYRYWELILFNYDCTTEDTESTLGNSHGSSATHQSSSQQQFRYSIDNGDRYSNRDSSRLANQVLRDVVGANISKFTDQTMKTAPRGNWFMSSPPSSPAAAAAANKTVAVAIEGSTDAVVTATAAAGDNSHQRRNINSSGSKSAKVGLSASGSGSNLSNSSCSIATAGDIESPRHISNHSSSSSSKSSSSSRRGRSSSNINSSGNNNNSSVSSMMSPSSAAASAVVIDSGVNYSGYISSPSADSITITETPPTKSQITAAEKARRTTTATTSTTTTDVATTATVAFSGDSSHSDNSPTTAAVRFVLATSPASPPLSPTDVFTALQHPISPASTPAASVVSPALSVSTSVATSTASYYSASDYSASASPPTS